MLVGAFMSWYDDFDVEKHACCANFYILIILSFSELNREYDHLIALILTEIMWYVILALELHIHDTFVLTDYPFSVIVLLVLGFVQSMPCLSCHMVSYLDDRMFMLPHTYSILVWCLCVYIGFFVSPLIIFIYCWTHAPVFLFVYFASAMLQMVNCRDVSPLHSSGVRGIIWGPTDPRGITFCISSLLPFPCMLTCFNLDLRGICSYIMWDSVCLPLDVLLWLLHLQASSFSVSRMYIQFF